MAVQVGDDDLDFGTAFTNVVTATTNSSTLWENTTTYANADSALTVNADGSTEFSNGFTVNGDVTMDGLSLIERLSIIESVLGIPARDAEMEEKYPHLKALHNECVEKITSALASQTYAEELEKLRTFEILKTDNGTNSTI